MIKIIKYETISEVPSEWDSIIGDNIYLSKKFLSFMETVDLCSQKYYMLYEDDVLEAVFMSHIREKYNLAMFTKFNLYQKMTMIYVPLSVTRPGRSPTSTHTSSQPVTSPTASPAPTLQ